MVLSFRAELYMPKRCFRFGSSSASFTVGFSVIAVNGDLRDKAGSAFLGMTRG